ncbi:MAG: PHP domain-containing protein [Halanaerobiaceae bacterium]
MNFIGDYHTHSEYSHGKGNLRKNIEMAIKMGLQELAITDHGPASWNFIRLGVKNQEELLFIKEKIALLQEEYPQIKLYSGVEANIINEDGELDVSEKILSQLDIVAAGFHLLIFPESFKSTRDIIINNRIIYRYFRNKRNDIRRRNTEILIKAVSKNSINFITHPGYKVDIDTYQLAKACAEENTYLEINARHGLLTEGFIRTAAETDVKFIVNSDSHSPEEIGEFSFVNKLIARLKISRERIVNLR